MPPFMYTETFSRRDGELLGAWGSVSHTAPGIWCKCVVSFAFPWTYYIPLRSTSPQSSSQIRLPIQHLPASPSLRTLMPYLSHSLNCIRPKITASVLFG